MKYEMEVEMLRKNKIREAQYERLERARAKKKEAERQKVMPVEARVTM